MTSIGRYLLIALCGLMAVACHNAMPPGFDGGRPTLGIADDDGEEPEEWLADPDPRYEGPDLSLRYSAGGVMITRDAGGATGFIDIDTGASAAYDPEAGILTVDGRALTVAADTLAASAGALWLRLTDSGGNIHLIVTEP